MPPFLTERQVRTLTLLGRNKLLVRDFYLTGGTPLAAFHLHHRYSEDLDFFSEKEVDPETIGFFLASIKNDLGYKRVDLQQHLNRNLFFLHFDDEVLKTEFTYFPFPRIEKGPVEYGIETDSILDIAVNKLFSIYQRTVQRDFIDLYLLCTQKGFSISELILKAKAKFDWHIDPLQLGTQFSRAKEATDPPRLILPLQASDWHLFFEQEALKLKDSILE